MSMPNTANSIPIAPISIRGTMTELVDRVQTIIDYLNSTPIENGGTASINKKLDDISGYFNGLRTVFTTTVAATNVTAASAQNLFISLNGIWQEPLVAYTVSGSTIRFTTPPEATMSFFGILAQSVDSNVPVDPNVPVESVNWTIGETPIGEYDGANTVFLTLNTFQPNTTIVYLNGLRLCRGSAYDYEESGNTTLIFTTAPIVTDIILVDYIT